VKYLAADIVSDRAYLIPIGDVHVGDRAFGKRGLAKLQGYLEWVASEPAARIFLMGDVFNAASRHSKTSPFETDSSEFSRAVELFRPVKSQILGAIDGNHEARMIDMFGYSPTMTLCQQLEIPYCGWSAVIELNVGNIKNRSDAPGTHREYRWNTYHIYAHHTTGGGQTLGGALNRSVKLQDIVQGVDVYLGGHNHQMVTGVRTVFRPHGVSHRMVEHKVTFVDCGGYLDWDESYAERGQMPPGKLGSPRLRFAGRRHTGHGNALENYWESRDVHVSL
jgi:hypothetical protein